MITGKIIPQKVYGALGFSHVGFLKANMVSEMKILDK